MSGLKQGIQLYSIQSRKPKTSSPEFMGVLIREKGPGTLPVQAQHHFQRNKREAVTYLVI